MALPRCASWSVWSARRFVQNATRSPPTNTCMVSHLWGQKQGRRYIELKPNRNALRWLVASALLLFKYDYINQPRGPGRWHGRWQADRDPHSRLTCWTTVWVIYLSWFYVTWNMLGAGLCSWSYGEYNVKKTTKKPHVQFHAANQK